jgi:hypothetical protein
MLITTENTERKTGKRKNAASINDLCSEALGFNKQKAGELRGHKKSAITREKKAKDYLKGNINNPIYVRRSGKNKVTIPSMEVSAARGSGALADFSAKVQWRELAQKDEPFEPPELAWQKNSFHQEYYDRSSTTLDQQLEQQPLGSSQSGMLPLIRNYRTEIDSKFLERGVKNSDIGTLASVNSGIAVKRAGQNGILQSLRRGQSQARANKFSSSRHGSLPSLRNSSTILPRSPAPKQVAIAPTNASTKRTQARAGSQLQLSATKTVAKSRLDILDNKLEDANSYSAIPLKAGRALDSSAAEQGPGDRRSSLLAYADRSTDKRKKMRKIGTINVN